MAEDRRVADTSGGTSRLPRSWAILLVLTAVLILVGGFQSVGVINLAGVAGQVSGGGKVSSETTGWTPIYREDFNTPAPLGSFLATYGSTFGAYPYPWADTSRSLRSDPGYYHPGKTLSVADGVMDAWLHYDAELGRVLVAAPYPKLPKMRYGRFALRLRAPAVHGYRIAPMLWPDSDRYPTDGEINMPEGGLARREFVAYAHYAQPAGTPGPTQDIIPIGVNGEDWHVYEIAWSPGKVEFFVDGESIGASTHAVPDKPMHWVLQFETLLNTESPSRSAEAHVYVDWVEAWKWDG
ncbi:MAG: glycoside hydrolase family 16 protein [Candidatus Nanopelagicales bacterium]|nr:glycoside hydrolase family 16 protein [Candidatus Nanopelagicales bacterium]